MSKTNITLADLCTSAQVSGWLLSTINRVDQIEEDITQIKGDVKHLLEGVNAQKQADNTAQAVKDLKQLQDAIKTLEGVDDPSYLRAILATLKVKVGL